MPAAKKRAKAAKVAAAPPREPVCGLVLPISAIDGCSPDHWLEVRSIVTEAINAITEAKFVVKLVSDADESGVIQKRIVQNLYSSEIVVCDVSGKNPNVMFELGLRLAFDKPTVIIKDDKTDYSFDTAIIEHVPYPRDLRFAKIVEFKKILSEKVAATYRISTTDPSHSTFLKNFGKFQVAALQQTEVPADKLILEILTELQNDVQNIKQRGDVSEGVRRSAILRAFGRSARRCWHTCQVWTYRSRELNCRRINPRSMLTFSRS